MDPNDLTTILFVAQYSTEENFAGMALVAYDYMLMLPNEIQYIWKSRWTPGKVLFLIVRYLPFVDFPMWALGNALIVGGSPLNCNFAVYWVLASLLISDMLAGIVYGLRTWALWNKNRIMGVFLIVVYVGIYVGVAVYETVFGSASSNTTIPGFSGCFLVSSPTDSSWEGYTLALIYQMVIFLATVFKGVEHLRYEPTKVTSVLYRDALTVAIIQLSVGISNIIIMRTTHQTNLALNATFRALTSVLPARIILNIREAATSLDHWDVTFVTQDSASTEARTTGRSGENTGSRPLDDYELEDIPPVMRGQRKPGRSVGEGER